MIVEQEPFIFFTRCPSWTAVCFRASVLNGRSFVTDERGIRLEDSRGRQYSVARNPNFANTSVFAQGARGAQIFRESLTGLLCQGHGSKAGMVLCLDPALFGYDLTGEVYHQDGYTGGSSVVLFVEDGGDVPRAQYFDVGGVDQKTGQRCAVTLGGVFVPELRVGLDSSLEIETPGGVVFNERFMQAVGIAQS